MKIKIILTLLTAITTALNAQTWSGTTPGNIYYNSGNVAIGTTSASSRLQLNADNDNSNALRLEIGKFSMGGSAKFSIDAVGIGDGRFVVKENGNVGIGVPSPNARLDIFGSNGNTTNIILSANYVDKYRWRMKTIDRGAAIDMDFTSSDGTDVEETVLKLTRSTSGRPEFQLYNNTIVANNGNVGMGTDNPFARLQLNADNQNNNALRLEIGRFSMNGTARFSIDADGVSDGRLVVKENGNVGIGTPNPDSKLTVAGDIHSREVRVTINAGSDFVFQDNYDLMTLNEVEQFVRENKHLPDIEPAKDMEEKGIELGKMNMKLLQKIEELTLYMIDFEKEMNKMKEENQKLKDRIIELKKD